jgi:sensor c-di-GMP phosphodiesterase-like protein
VDADDAGDADNAVIASNIITMAHGLGLKMVAEGVETPGSS